MVNRDTLIPKENISQEIIKMVDFAESFIKSYQWCSSVRSIYLDRCIPAVISIFLIEIEPISDDVDNEMWVIVGDIPPSYIDTFSCKTGMEALDAYIFCLEEWVINVKEGASLDEVMPVYYSDGREIMAANKKNAALISSKINTLREIVIPWLKDWSPAD